MLVGIDEYVNLVGYMRAPVDGPSFVIPLFRARASNMLLVQEIGSNGLVAELREVQPREVHLLNESAFSVRIGEAALWGFREADGNLIFGDRSTLQQTLIRMLDAINEPFVRLQVAQFCDGIEKLTEAWRVAFRHLSERSPRSADAWRDVVVIPSQVRLAIEDAILTHGLDASAETVTRSVAVDVRHDEVTLRLGSDLHVALSENPNARRSVERATNAVRSAFDLPDAPLALTKFQDIGQAAAEPSDWDGIAVVGFGEMAFSLVGGLIPRQKSSSDHRYHGFAPARSPENRPIIMQRGEIFAIDWATSTAEAELREDVHTVFVIFQLNMDRSELIKLAIDYAHENRRRDRRIIAVFPHFPEAFETKYDIGESLLGELRKEFAAVWALSDRSPYTRQALPFGPARSVPAATKHLELLLAMAKSGRTAELLMDREGDGLGIVGSATGDSSFPRLVEHCLARVGHYRLNLEAGTVAQMWMPPEADLRREQIAQLVRRECPQAEVRVETADSTDTKSSRVSILLKDVALLPATEKSFANYCMLQLERHKWTVAIAGNQDVVVSALTHGPRDVPVQFAFSAEKSLEPALRARKRRENARDGILLTNATIRRRNFATHVLNGTMPLHSSRIESMHRIFQRRFSYVLTYLLQEKRSAARLMIPAAVDYINIESAVRDWGYGQVRHVGEDDFGIDYQPSNIVLTLDLQVRRRNERKAYSLTGSARLRFDAKGWAILALNVNDSEPDLR